MSDAVGPYNHAVVEIDVPWDMRDLDDAEAQWILDSAGLVSASDDGLAVVDPETDEAWALCWVRIPKGLSHVPST